ncbi:FKBP-type peptidyl-prolyl cis-trans isomerase [Arundinibacter roseus]|uniref:Peptidyl-prolyl cis-trans isomerase n=1 Tax=Arundinibacter roseus TaxID=2070510 RepID=A0A4R4KKK0_9BACT|nr:FKBP-type peptidyl-prolyl cis-trans isomerase [Arundinibacter roseus]TDB68774.1 peptidylprolyl isomerase [Arundinibacter roseus]
MNLKSIGIVLGVCFLAASCNQHRVQVTESGLKYQFHEHDDDAPKSKLGDIVSFHLLLKNSEDSVLRDTYKENLPVKLVLQQPPFKGSFEEGLAMLAKGDSATFFVSADTLFAKMMQPLPPMVKKGTDLTFTVKVLNVQSSEDFQKDQAAKGAAQKSVDAKIISDYLAKNKLTAQKTESGLHYIVQTPGSGATPAQGDVVKVHYTGKLLDGKVFDSSIGNPQTGGKPIDFQVGVGMVIPGWEEGIMSMRKGEKRTLIIPSGLAYGSEGSGPIPANAVLLFDVELVDFSKSGTGNTPAGNTP